MFSKSFITLPPSDGPNPGWLWPHPRSTWPRGSNLPVQEQLLSASTHLAWHCPAQAGEWGALVPAAARTPDRGADLWETGAGGGLTRTWSTQPNSQKCLLKPSASSRRQSCPTPRPPLDPVQDSTHGQRPLQPPNVAPRRAQQVSALTHCGHRLPARGGHAQARTAPASGRTTRLIPVCHKSTENDAQPRRRFLFSS